jgi:hypothetical protein
METTASTEVNNKLLEELEDWIKYSEYVKDAPMLKGGWERWASADFAMYLNNHKSEEALTEIYSYHGLAERCDVLIRRTSKILRSGGMSKTLRPGGTSKTLTNPNGAK